MKKLLVGLCAVFICTMAIATTVNINWTVDNANYANTTCETGGDLILPTPTPTKYGYTFRGWQTEIINGTFSRNGTPSPTNPIEPVFYQNGNLILRAIGEGDNMVKDSFDPLNGKITRRVGVKVLNGTENFSSNNDTPRMYGFNFPSAAKTEDRASPVCTHFQGGRTIYQKPGTPLCVFGYYFVNGLIFRVYDLWPTVEDFKQWLATQYANGTPVTVYYEKASPSEENFQ